MARASGSCARMPWHDDIRAAVLRLVYTGGTENHCIKEEVVEGHAPRNRSPKTTA
jgi:hypothetical protein